MGFFSDLWEGIKSTAGSVYSGVKKGLGAVYDVVRKPVDIIAGAGNLISKIPILGSLAQPIIGAARGAQSVLDQGKAVADVAKQIGLKSGGVVPPSRMFQKAE
jgi:phage-related protein